MSKSGKTARTLVLKADGESRVPFLRGILAQSLHDAGLPFDKAHELASRIRQELMDVSEITANELARKVTLLLRNGFPEVIAQRYDARNTIEPPILIRDLRNRTTPFSKVRLTQCLESCALSQDLASAITHKIHEQLLRSRVSETTSAHICRLAYEVLDADLGPEMARRYLVWVEFQRSGRPLVLLLGGTNGAGKSSVSAEIAHRLGIARIQSTDMLREVMRLMISQELMPALHASSYNAWETLPGREEAEAGGRSESLLLDGFLTQAEQVRVAIDAAWKRSLRERVSLILEGVHLYPGYMDRTQDTQGFFVPVMLAVLSREQLRKQLEGRGSQAPSRRAERYIKHLDDIWQLQGYLLFEADRLNIPIIPNMEVERTVEKVLESITTVLSREFSGDRKRVLG